MVTESRHTETAKVEPADTTRLIAVGLSFLLVVALALLANRLTQMSKAWLGRDLLEYPLWAVMLG